MIRLRCPTGCPGALRRPHALRAEPVRCPNCRAWLSAPDRMEDGGLAEAILLAAPGARLPRPAPTPQRLGWWLAAAVALALLAFAGVRIAW